MGRTGRCLVNPWEDEQVVGRIRNDRGWDKRYRPPWRQAEPYRHTWRDHARDAAQIVVGLVIGIPLLYAFFIALIAIASPR